LQVATTHNTKLVAVINLHTDVAEKVKSQCIVAVGRCCILEELKSVGEFLSVEGSIEGKDGSKIGPVSFLVDTGSEVFCLTESIFVRSKKKLAGSKKIQGAHSRETKDVYNITVYVEGEQDVVLVSHGSHASINLPFHERDRNSLVQEI